MNATYRPSKNLLDREYNTVSNKDFTDVLEKDYTYSEDSKVVAAALLFAVLFWVVVILSVL